MELELKKQNTQAECGKCHIIVDYYQVRAIKFSITPAMTWADLDIICRDCNRSPDFSPAEMVTRSRALMVLRAEVIKDKTDDRK